MTEDQNTAYIISMAMMFFAKVSGMNTENAYSMCINGVPRYREDAFEAVANESGCHHNAVIDTFKDTRIVDRGES